MLHPVASIIKAVVMKSADKSQLIASSPNSGIRMKNNPAAMENIPVIKLLTRCPGVFIR